MNCKMFGSSSRTILLAIGAACATTQTNVARAEIWPVGSDFVIGMYTVGTAADMERVAADGFNLVHTYVFDAMTPEQYLTKADELGIKVMLPIGNERTIPAATQANVQTYAQYDSLGWWYFSPEEPHFWIPSEMQAMADAAEVIRQGDHLNRPIFTYQQNHFTAENLAHYAPYQDGMGAGIYANFVDRPRPWVRWRTEENVRSVELGGNLPGQFAVAVLPMFDWEGRVPITGADAYHDAYLTLVAGSKALLIYGDAYRNTVDAGVYQAYKQVAEELNGDARLGEVFLYGDVLDGLHPIILSGPQQSEAFNIRFEGEAEMVQYDSISHRVAAYDGRIYLTAVNSADATISAEFYGVRYTGIENVAEVMFQNRTVALGPRSFTDSLDALAAHTYRLPASAELVVREDHFDTAHAWHARYGDGAIVVSDGVGLVSRGSESTEYFYRELEAGSLPAGAFLELKINAPADTSFYLQLVSADMNPLAVIDWQHGTGSWQTIQVPFEGAWWGSNNVLWLGISGGSSYEVDALGIYYSAHTPEPSATIAAMGSLMFAARRPTKSSCKQNRLMVTEE